jgi:SNF family Na+-dependent transporter
MGVMTAYSAHNHKNKSTLVLDEKIIGISDMSIALLEGFTIYSFMGHQCHLTKQQTPAYDCTALYSTKSMGLAFDVFPNILLELGSGWLVAFFLTLWLLGIDSAFSMLDAVKTGIMDYEFGNRVFKSREICTSVLTLLGVVLSVFFCTEDGLIWLDIID